MKVAVHNGDFHADECMAITLVKQLFDIKEIIRTRQQDLIDSCDLVLDVGGVYNKNELKFDHHQNSFAETFDENSKIPLCSCGLIFRDFGKQILQKLLNCEEEQINFAYKFIYQKFIMPIDGGDNGIDEIKGEYQYSNSVFSIQSRIARYNKIADFETACKLAESEFFEYIKYFQQQILSKFKYVEQLFINRFKTHESGKILEGEDISMSLVDYFQIQFKCDILYLISFKDEQWRIRAVNLNEHSFESKKPLDKQWRGLRDDQLTKVSGIEGGIFVHKSGFLGVWKQRDSIMKVIEHMLK